MSRGQHINEDEIDVAFSKQREWEMHAVWYTDPEEMTKAQAGAQR